MKYDFHKIEKYWQKRWREEGIYEPDLEKAKKPFYNLMMFPYPSAEGLHVGNMYAFTGSDIYGRFKRMQGYDVFEPIGLDGFGIHSENYALKTGRHPAEQAKISEKNFYRQLEEIGNGFAWNEKLETYDPEYYKWTQWIFVQMFKRGLAYRKKQSVNWCPLCLTVLADEQVQGGRCERCESLVEKKELEQWFFKTTEYAERLLKDLEKLDWSEKIKIAQKNWIGKSEGALVKFQIPNSNFQIEVFTTRPDTLFGATYMVLSPEHTLIKNLENRIQNLEEVKNYIKKAEAKSEEERIAEGREKTGVELRGVKAINPANQEEIPVWVADYVLGHVGTGAIMAVPAHDERDFEFAKTYKLPIVEVIQSSQRKEECWEGEGRMANSGEFTGMDSEKAKWEITKLVKAEKKVQYRLRDWLISRQRYWGPPIPMIFCEACAKQGKGEQKEMPGWYAVAEKDLPVLLPHVEDFRPKGTGRAPLASVESFYKVKCPTCGGEARRETDVSDTFLDSAWYYLRYLNPKNSKEPFDKLRVKKWLPVHMYIGGAEHAVLHLLYVRFLAKTLHDWRLVGFDEPAKKFRAHGLLIREGAKISKSKGNVINPDFFIKKFGADAFRLHLMFLGPFEEGGDFRDHGILGPVRFLERVWKLHEKTRSLGREDEIMTKALHRTIKKITEDIEALRYNTAVSALMTFVNQCEKIREMEKETYENFLKLLAPFVPHITEELWREILEHKISIHREPWPAYDQKFVEEMTFALVIQVNGRMRDVVQVSKGISEKEAEKRALSRDKVKSILGSQKPERVIYVPERLINIVI